MERLARLFKFNGLKMLGQNLFRITAKFLLFPLFTISLVILSLQPTLDFLYNTLSSYKPLWLNSLNMGGGVEDIPWLPISPNVL